MTISADAKPSTLSLGRADWELRRWRELLRFKLYGIDTSVEWDEPVSLELMQAIEAGAVLVKPGRFHDDVRLDACSFRAWLLRQGARPSQPRPVTALDSTSRDVHPATAAAWIAFGDAWALDRVSAFLNRRHRVHLMICQHDAGAVVLDPAAKAVAHEILSAQDVFNAARDEIEIAIRTLSVEAYAANEGRALRAGDFSSPVWLDVVKGRYVAGPASEVLSDDWHRAVAAAERIGAARVCGDDFIRKFGRRRSNALMRHRAADALRGLLEAWRRGDASIPKRVEWERGVGSELAGSAYAAGSVWEDVTRDPVYAAARAPGRRRGAENPPK